MLFLLGLFLGCAIGFLFAGLCGISRGQARVQVTHDELEENLTDVA